MMQGYGGKREPSGATHTRIAPSPLNKSHLTSAFAGIRSCSVTSGRSASTTTILTSSALFQHVARTSQLIDGGDSDAASRYAAFPKVSGNLVPADDVSGCPALW